MAASAAEEKSEQGSSLASAPAAGKGRLVLILTAVNIIVTLGMVAILFISFQRDKNHPAVEDIAAHQPVSDGKHDAKGEEGKAGADGHGAKDAQKKASAYGKMVTLELFTVNLATPGSVNPKFVRVNISLEVPTEDIESEVTSKMPQVRNAIIDLFNSKRPTDLATADGRDYLKEEIRNALNGFLVSGKVKGVFFTNFALSG